MVIDRRARAPGQAGRRPRPPARHKVPHSSNTAADAEPVELVQHRRIRDVRPGPGCQVAGREQHRSQLAQHAIVTARVPRSRAARINGSATSSVKWDQLSTSRCGNTRSRTAWSPTGRVFQFRAKEPRLGSALLPGRYRRAGRRTSRPSGLSPGSSAGDRSERGTPTGGLSTQDRGAAQWRWPASN